MNKMGIVLGLAVFCGMAGAGFAEEAVWVNLSDKTPLWSELSNWTDGGGGPLASIPTGTTCNVSFPDAPVGVTRQTVKLDVFTTTNSLNTTAIGAVSDAVNTPGEDWSRRLILIDNKNSTVVDYEGRLTVGNPDAFHGYWSFSRSLGRLTLPATPVYTPKLSAVSAKARPEIEVADADAKAKLGSVFEDGAVRKIGAGELEVARTTGGGTRFYVSGGGLTLEGVAPASEPEAGDDLPVAGAAFHLDATIPRTLVTTNETARETGRTFVTRWSDVRDNGMYAYYDENQTWSQSYRIPYANAPFLNTTDASGRTFVDFGRNNAAYDEGYGPTNCLLRFSETLTNCREVFFVASKITSSASTAPVGDSNVNPFHSGGASTLVSETYAPDVRYGFILINGEVTGNDAAWPAHKSVEETQLGVISFASTNRVILSTLATDRFYADRSGGWRLGEVVIYTNVLTTAERYAVHQHLRRKWQGGDAADVGAVVLNPGASIGVPEGRTARVTEVTAIDGTLVKTGAGTLEVGALSAKTAETVKSLDIRGGAVKVTLPATALASAGAVTVEEGTLVTTFASVPDLPQPRLRYDASEESTFTAKYVSEGTTFVTSVSSLGTYTRTLQTGKGATTAAVTNPSVETVEMRTGINRPCFNFGQRGGSNDKGTGPACLQASVSSTELAEYHVIVADNVAEVSPLYQNLFSNLSSPSQYFKRTSQKLLANDSAEALRNGYLALDGEEKVYTENLPTGFHLFSAVPTAPLPVSYLCMARDGSVGGLKVAEMLVYDATNSVKHRAYIQDQLMHKWFDAPAPKWEFPVASVSVAEGATWRDTSTNMIHTVGTLALGGTADVDEMTVAESVTLSGAVAVTGDLTLADGIEIPLTVTDAALSVGGTLTFAGAATIMFDDAAFSRLGTGDRVLFSAAEIVGFNRNAVTLDASGIPAKRSFSLVETVDAVSGKTTAIRLRVSIPGMTVIFR